MCISCATTAQSLPGSALIVVIVDEEYGEEDMLATVVSGLVLGCILVVVPDHHPIVVVQSGVARTLPARQQEKAKDVRISLSTISSRLPPRLFLCFW